MMSSSCAVQGVVQLKKEFIDEVHALYLTPDHEYVSHSREEVTHYLFGVNIGRYIEAHFSEKAANGSFNHADFETGCLTFVSGFSSSELEQFIEKVKAISDHYILYIIYEDSIKVDNELVVIKDLEKLDRYVPKFNDHNFIESEIPFGQFDQNGAYFYVERLDYDSSFGFGDTTEHLWERQEAL